MLIPSKLDQYPIMPPNIFLVLHIFVHQDALIPIQTTTFQFHQISMLHICNDHYLVQKLSEILFCMESIASLPPLVPSVKGPQQIIKSKAHQNQVMYILLDGKLG